MCLLCVHFPNQLMNAKHNDNRSLTEHCMYTHQQEAGRMCGQSPEAEEHVPFTANPLVLGYVGSWETTLAHREASPTVW